MHAKYIQVIKAKSLTFPILKEFENESCIEFKGDWDPDIYSVTAGYSPDGGSSLVVPSFSQTLNLLPLQACLYS